MLPSSGILTHILSDGFTDAYTVFDSALGYTCCAPLVNPAAVPSQRIDYILYRNFNTLMNAAVCLDGTFMQGAGYYRISDHAGVKAELVFP